MSLAIPPLGRFVLKSPPEKMLEERDIEFHMGNGRHGLGYGSLLFEPGILSHTSVLKRKGRDLMCDFVPEGEYHCMCTATVVWHIETNITIRAGKTTEFSVPPGVVGTGKIRGTIEMENGKRMRGYVTLFSERIGGLHGKFIDYKMPEFYFSGLPTNDIYSLRVRVSNYEDVLFGNIVANDPYVTVSMHTGYEVKGNVEGADGLPERVNVGLKHPSIVTDGEFSQPGRAYPVDRKKRANTKGNSDNGIQCGC